MTPNMLILLLDCKRGFSAECHTGTLESDVAKLRRLGLLGKDMELTTAGLRLCTSVCDAAYTLRLPKEKQLELIRSHIAATQEGAASTIKELEDEIARITREVE